MISILAQELSAMSQEENANLPALCTAMQDAISRFGETLLMYLEMQVTDAMNHEDEQVAADNEVLGAYWKGKIDLGNQLITLLKPLSTSE